MGASEPAYEQVGSFARCLTIERHQGCWPTGETHKVGAPPVGLDRKDFDLVNAPVDRLFESVCGHDAEVPSLQRSTRSRKRRSYREYDWRQAK